MQRKHWTLAAVVVALFMLLLDITVVNTALPSIQRSLGASFTDLQWVVDAYTLPLAAVVLSAGSLADRLGRRRVFVVGIVIFTLASLACALAPTAGFLIAARAVQGVGGAVMFALALALVAQEFPPGRERGRAMAVFGATIGAAVAIGPLVGGALTETVGWQAVFYLNLPLGCVTLAIALTRLREARDPQARNIDWAGLVTLSVGLFALVFALLRGNVDGWGSATIVSAFVVAGALLLAFVAVEHRGPEPMLPLELFRGRTFTGVQIAAFAVSVSLFALFLYITLYLQQFLGDSPLGAGLRYLPITLATLLAAGMVGAIIDRVPARVLLGTGLGLTSAGLFLMARVEVGSAWTVLLPGFIISGVGAGIANAVTGDVAMSVVSDTRSGMAAGINDTFRQVGIAVGIAAWGAIFLSSGAARAEEFAGVGGHGRQLVESVSTGAVQHLADPLEAAARAGFVTGFRDVLAIGGAVAFVGAVAAAALVRESEIRRTAETA